MAEAPRLKPQTVTEILDSSFRLYRENFAQFLGVLALIYLPAIILQMIITAQVSEELLILTQKAREAGAHPDPAVVMKIAFTNFLQMGALVLISGLTLPLATGALTRAVSSRYLNEPTSIGSCYAFIFRIFGRYLGTILLMGLVIPIGLMCCLVPGILFAIWFAFTSSVIVLEGMGGTAAMGRSKQLAQGNAGRIIGLWFIILLVSLALNFAVGQGLLFALAKSGLSPVRQTVISHGVEQVIHMILSPFFSVAWVLLYYDIRIRKEGFDLEVLARSMAEPKGFFPPPPAAPQTPA